MDYLQYLSKFNKMTGRSIVSFKPYYKWITFNTKYEYISTLLNCCFKPYYKWITFNTENAQKFNETVNKF